MKGQAFCPAHVTGFFKASVDGARGDPESAGSLGAGFSIMDGVTTTVTIGSGEDRRRGDEPAYRISTGGFGTGDTHVSEHVIGQFLKLRDRGTGLINVRHEISIPVGYGLGCSGAAALSLAYAMDEALQTELSREEMGRIAHVAEVSCRTGLGDVLASYHGGFEIRTAPGAPGIGRVEKLDRRDMSAVIACLAPVSTTDFLRDRLCEINGLGGRMVDRLRRTRNWRHFQDMSLEFAGYVDVITPRMQKIVDCLHSNGVRCGVALFGETVFSLVPSETAGLVAETVSRCAGQGAIIINSKIDQRGARLTRYRGDTHGRGDYHHGADP